LINFLFLAKCVVIVIANSFAYRL